MFLFQVQGMISQSKPVHYRSFIAKSSESLHKVTLSAFRNDIQPDYLLYSLSKQTITPEA